MEVSRSMYRTIDSTVTDYLDYAIQWCAFDCVQFIKTSTWTSGGGKILHSFETTTLDQKYKNTLEPIVWHPQIVRNEWQINPYFFVSMDEERAHTHTHASIIICNTVGCRYIGATHKWITHYEALNKHWTISMPNRFYRMGQWACLRVCVNSEPPSIAVACTR